MTVDLKMLEGARECELTALALEEINRTVARVLREQTLKTIKAPPAKTLEFKWLLDSVPLTQWRIAHPPEPPAESSDVRAKLKAICFTMREIRVGEHVDALETLWFEAHAEVKPLRVSELSAAPESCTLNGAQRRVRDMSGQALIKLARQAMIDLFAHELDEHLFVAGLGPDPHADDFKPVML